MTASVAGSSHPGLTVGPTSEFSLFFRVKPGQGPSLRSALKDLQDTPGYRPGDYGMAVQTIHEARFVLFDDDTRLAFITSVVAAHSIASPRTPVKEAYAGAVSKAIITRSMSTLPTVDCIAASGGV